MNLKMKSENFGRELLTIMLIEKYNICLLYTSDAADDEVQV